MTRRSVAEIVEELDQHMCGAEQLWTLTRSDFYKLCGRERFKQPFLDEVREVASDSFQLIVAYGHKVVIVCHDRNFANVPSGKIIPRRSVVDIIEELNEFLRRSARPYLTLVWPEFYELCGRERLRFPFLEEVREAASERFQLVVGYGHNVVVVCHDRNFAKLDSEE